MDGLTLALDAATYEGSVAAIRGGVVVAQRTVAMRGEREERLMPAVAAVLVDCGVLPRDITRVVCGAGPGSFTSLRIAASIAKGLAMATGAPLYAVSSLALAAVEAGKGRWLVTLDAMRGEVYVECHEVLASGFTRQASGTPQASGLPQATGLRPQAEVSDLAISLRATVLPGRPHARSVAPLLNSIVDAGPVDLATWEPDYGRKAEAQVKWEAAQGRPLVP